MGDLGPTNRWAASLAVASTCRSTHGLSHHVKTVAMACVGWWRQHELVAVERLALCRRMPDGYWCEMINRILKTPEKQLIIGYLSHIYGLALV